MYGLTHDSRFASRLVLPYVLQAAVTHLGLNETVQSGDGDTGTSLASMARALLQHLPTLEPSDPATICSQLGSIQNPLRLH
jgi:hypothetical protein